MLKWSLIAAIVILANSGNVFNKTEDKTPIKKEYVGTWVGLFTTINVRTKTGFLSYAFTKGRVGIELQINEDNTASGKIGNSEFRETTIKKNKGAGIAYIIDCGEVGKLFYNDPEEKKSLQLWLIPLTQSDTLRAELRLNSADKYPMGEFKMSRKNSKSE